VSARGPIFRGVMSAALLLTIGLMPIAAHADKPQVGAVPSDPRVRTIPFVPDQIVALHGHYGFQMMIEFNPDERIENVAIGDSLAWQVTPNRRADTLFVKPIEADATTNLAVVTNKRRYAFVLTAGEAMGADDPELVFRVRFSYPLDEAAALAEAETPIAISNAAYSVSGSTKNVPARIFDDGTRTYFEWAAGAATPAVFAVAADGTETVVNFAMRGAMMVVERVSPAFVLRNGADQTLVFNDGWREAAPGPETPRSINPDKGKSLFQRLFGRNPAGAVR
jgi:type IV secretion system protein VirB9